MAIENALLNEEIYQTTNLQLQKTNHALAQLDKTKSDFVSIIAHELRTPLTPIKATLQILSDEETQKTISTSVINTALNSINRLSTTIITNHAFIISNGAF